MPAITKKPITKDECLLRTRKMLARVTKTSLSKIKPDSKLRSDPPFPPLNDQQIANLEGPIETRDFADVHAAVTQHALKASKTVANLRDIIYAAIPSVPAPKKHPIKDRSSKPHAAPLPQANNMTKQQCLQRTREMLSDLTNTSLAAILPGSELRDDPFPPMNDNQIRNLEGPIETSYFSSVHAQVTQSDLISTTTVGDLRDVIWDGIPNQFKA